MTHYSRNVSRRLLIKQNAHVLFCAFCTVHCKWTCLCGSESATYSSKLPLWHILDSLGALGPGRGWAPFIMGTPAHMALWRHAPGRLLSLTDLLLGKPTEDFSVPSCPSETASEFLED